MQGDRELQDPAAKRVRRGTSGALGHREGADKSASLAHEESGVIPGRSDTVAPRAKPESRAKRAGREVLVQRSALHMLEHSHSTVHTLTKEALYTLRSAGVHWAGW